MLRKIKGTEWWICGAMAIFCLAAETSAQDQGVTTVSTYIRPGTVNASGGIWGYTGTDKKEYALLTTQEPGGLSVLEIWDGTKAVVPPKERGYITAGGNSLWQEVVTCGGPFAFRISQTISMGLQVIDLRPLNTGGDAKEIKQITTFFSTAHAFYCDETVTPNRLFVTYENTAGIKIFSMEDPLNPKLLSTTVGQAHDSYARGNRMYAYKGSAGTIFIYDITNPAAPVRMGTITPPRIGYMHSGELSEDGKYLFTATETSGIPMYIYDVSDPVSPKKVGEFPAIVDGITNKILHNVYVKGNTIFLGHYQSGLRVLDITNPIVPKEYAFQRHSTNTSQWGGTWGAYPHFKSGLVIYGEMQKGLFVVKVIDNPNTRITNRFTQSTLGFEGFQNGLLNFRLPESGTYQISLRTSDGREAYHHNAIGTAGTQTLAVSKDLASGNYALRLSHNESVLNTSIMLKK